MSNNPYATDSAEPAKAPIRRAQAGLAALFVLFILSWIVASLVTPADPLSSLLAMVPIYGVSLVGYFFGLRAST